MKSHRVSLLFTLLVLLAWLPAAALRADVTLKDTGYTEYRRAGEIYLTRSFVIDTGAQKFTLVTDGTSVGLPGGNWHPGELFIVSVTDDTFTPEKFFEFTNNARKEGFVEKIAFQTKQEADVVTVQGTTTGQTARITFVITARGGDDKLHLNFKVEPTGKLMSTLIGFECYPNSGEPRHKLHRAVTTAQRTEELVPGEAGGKRFMLNKDEAWFMMYDKALDKGAPTLGDRVAHGGCGLFYLPQQTTKAFVQMGNIHLDPRFEFPGQVTDMSFVLLDMTQKSNDEALKHMQSLGEKGFSPMSKAPVLPLPDGAAAAAAVAAGPQSRESPAPAPRPAASAPAATRVQVRPGEPITLVREGQSAYVIYHTPDAPTSVREAAAELQRVLAIATGATLPIQTAAAPQMIALGDSPHALQVGISAQSLPYEHYQLRSIGPNLYIVGRDTADGQQTQWGGVSMGTRYGVMAFLERVVGARWIMPGDLGEEIPRTSTLAVSTLHVDAGPSFSTRVLYLAASWAFEQWALRHGAALRAGIEDKVNAMTAPAGHGWDYLMPALQLEHFPQWAAVGGDANKFCTSKPEAVQAYIKNCVRWLDRHPEAFMVNAAPSDGQGFCRCPECAARYERDPHQQESVSSIIGEFYNEVARGISAQRPGHMVSGFAYGKTTYPPQNVTLEPNIHILWTPLNYYGLGLYKPGYHDEFERVAAQWRAQTPNVSYWCYHYWHRSDNGAPYAAAVSLMKFQFDVLARHGFRGVTEEGTPNLAYGGPINYLLVKLMWDAHADVDALYQEWLTLAYGPGASAMGEIFTLLDDGFRDFKVNREPFHYHGDNYEIMADKLEAIYLPRLARIEELYQQALAAAQEPRQRRRVEMFGDNMVVFHYHLRKAGFLEKPEKSFFFRSDAAYDRFMQTPQSTDANDTYGQFRNHLSRLIPIKRKVVTQASQFKAQQRELTIARRAGDTPIVLDGRINAAEWQGAGIAQGFQLTAGGGAAPQATTVRALYDDQALHLAFECREEQVDLIPARTLQENSMGIFQDNTLEVFLADPAGKVWHLVLDPANNHWSGIGNSAQLVTWSSATTRGDRLWVAEMSVPWSSLGLTPTAGLTLRGNFARARILGDDRQHSTWNAVNAAFLEPANFGAWRLAP
jgi:hypothetical protein